MRLVACLILCAGVGCSAGIPEEAKSPHQAPLAPVASAPRVPGTLLRSEIETAVNRGLGEFLQRVEVEPSLEGGQFQGFRVLTLTPPEFWIGVDLHAGDIVTQVNGQSIEDPNQAFEIFSALTSAAELRVELLRDGQPKTLRFPIVGTAATSPAASNP